jgi:hypothetical protein
LIEESRPQWRGSSIIFGVTGFDAVMPKAGTLMRFSLLLLLVLFIPQGACGSQGSDTAASSFTNKIVVTQVVGTGPWLHRQGSKDPVSQNQPNPATSYTVIYFYVGQTGPVSLKLYDATGKFMGYFVDGPCVAGMTYRVFFPVGMLATGEYLYCFRTSEFTIVKKMVVVK